MRKIGITLVVVVLICASCDKKTQDPQYSGEVILSSELLLNSATESYNFYGFSFETGEVSLYPPNGRPDLSVILESLVPLVVVIESSNTVDPFYKNGIFTTAEEAEAYFNTYKEVITNDFQAIARNIKENQVWTIQTQSKRFAKIWIKEIVFQTGKLSDFVELKIQYEYQPDGSRTFDCECN